MKTTFRCMSFNLRVAVTVDGPNYWPFRLHAVTVMIRQHHPDFLATQEVTDGMAKDLEKPLENYVCCGDGRDADRHGERCALYIRKKDWQIEHTETVWLSDTPEVPGSGDPEEGYPRICTMALVSSLKTSARLLILNVHLSYRSPRAREQNIVTLLRFIDLWKEKYACPVILLGDFNATPDHPIHQVIRGHGLLSSLDRSATGVRSTFHGFLGGKLLETIDYIYYTNEVTCLTFDVDQSTLFGRYPSDHFPIIANFELLKGKPNE